MEKEGTSRLQTELDAIFQTIIGLKGRASREQIRQALHLKIEPKTLQRRLALLVNEGKLYAHGNTKGTYYYPVTWEEESIIIHEPPAKYPSGKLLISIPGQKLMASIRRPLAQRKPVGYNLSFIQRYQPNKNFYLSAAERNTLGETGNTTSGELPAGTYARQVLNRLLIDLSWNSSRLEGNTYSLLDTQRLLSEGQATSGKSDLETQMILNHKDAIEFLVQDADEAIGFNRYTIQSLHALLSNNLLGDPAASGRLRRFGVGITNSVYTPLSIPQQVEEMFSIFLEKAGAITNPFEQAFFAMVHLPYLQPFDDVNKRVSRLAANIPLNRYNLSPLSFTGVPQDLYVAGLLGVYEQNDISLLKDVFLHAYARSAVAYASIRQTLGEPDPFRIKYRQQMRDSIRAIITAVVPKAMAPVQISSKAKELPSADRQQFLEAVETELITMHEGNFARYGITPSQYKAWRNSWDEQ